MTRGTLVKICRGILMGVPGKVLRKTPTGLLVVELTQTYGAYKVRDIVHLTPADVRVVPDTVDADPVLDPLPKE